MYTGIAAVYVQEPGNFETAVFMPDCRCISLHVGPRPSNNATVVILSAGRKTAGSLFKSGGAPPLISHEPSSSV